MKLINRLLLLSFVSPICIFSQSLPHIEWVKNYSERDQIENIPSAIDANNNVYITGYSYSSGSRNYTTIKYDASGVEQWVKRYDGTGLGEDLSHAVVVDNQGYVYVTGESTNASGDKDIITIKYDASGNVVWTEVFDGLSNGDDIGYNIQVDQSGSVFVSGLTTLSNNTTSAIVVKYDGQGQEQWSYDYQYNQNADSKVQDFDLDNSGLYLTVNSNDNLLEYTSLIALDKSNGSVLWNQSWGSSSEKVSASKIDLQNGNIALSGAIDNNTQVDYFTYYISTAGNVVWEKQYNGYNNNSYATDVQFDQQGNVVSTGIVQDASGKVEYHTVKYDPTGDQLWLNKELTYTSSISSTPRLSVCNGSIYIAGQKWNEFNHDVFIYQMDDEGFTNWTKLHNGLNNGEDAAVDLICSGSGALYVAAQTQNSNAKFDYTTIKIAESPVNLPADIDNSSPKTPLAFYQNYGQIKDLNNNPVEDFQFYTQSGKPNHYFGKDRFAVVYSKIDTVAGNQDSLHRVDFVFDGGVKRNEINTIDRSHQYLNYFIGNEKSFARVPGYERLLVRNIYNNIDLHYTTDKDGVKYYFVVKPGGDPSVITHLVQGANATTINNGQLEVQTDLGDFILDEPLAYQEINNQIVNVNVAGWNAVSTDKYNFNIPSYDAGYDLIIRVKRNERNDTPVPARNLCWSTYFGGSDVDRSLGIDHDETGNQYIAGFTLSSFTTFPETNDAFQGDISGALDAFYAKFNLNHALEYATYFGGTSNTVVAQDIKVKSENEVVIAGYTTSDEIPDFQLPGAYKDADLNSGGSIVEEDGFIAIFDASGFCSHTTYFGGDNSDKIYAIDFDEQGNLYVSGGGESPNFPLDLSNGTPQSNQGGTDGFIAKFNTGYAMQWSTFIGGDDNERIYSMHVKNNRVHTWGQTRSSNYPTTGTGGYVEASLEGAYDNFISVMDLQGTLLWSTYIGGSDYEADFTNGANNIFLNGISGNLYVVGNTQSSDFFLKDPAGSNDYYESNYSGNLYGDSYLMQFDASFNLLWSTYIPGPNELRVVTADGIGNIFIGGSTGNDNFPLLEEIPTYYYQDQLIQTPGFTDSEESVLFHFNESRILEWGTFFGGENTNTDGEAFVDMSVSNGSLFATGFTSAQSSGTQAEVFPKFDPGNGAYYEDVFGGNLDGFISKFCVEDIVGVTSFKEDKQQIDVYPNPTNDILNIEYENTENAAVYAEVYDLSGKIVLRKNLKNNFFNQLFISDLESGVYLLRLTESESTIGTKKIVKQ